MCQKLLQVYACRHKKAICLTPCPHAISTGLRIYNDQNVHKSQPSIPGLISRSSSVVSSIAPSVHRSAVQDVASQRLPSREPSESLPSPLRAGLNTVNAQERVSSVPAFRFAAPSQSRVLSPPPGYSQPSPTSPTAPSTLPPSPVATIRTQSSRSTPTSPSFSQASSEEPVIEPNYCAHYFPRHLSQSLRPCLQCYMQPEYETQRISWRNVYRADHILVKPEELEEVTGLERLKQEWSSRQ